MHKVARPVQPYREGSNAMIKTWQQRCEDHEGIVTNQMILERMQEEIDELRQALAQPVDLAKVGEVGVWDENERLGLYEDEPTKRDSLSWVGLTKEKNSCG